MIWRVSVRVAENLSQFESMMVLSDKEASGHWGIVLNDIIG